MLGTDIVFASTDHLTTSLSPSNLWRESICHYAALGTCLRPGMGHLAGTMLAPVCQQAWKVSDFCELKETFVAWLPPPKDNWHAQEPNRLISVSLSLPGAQTPAPQRLRLYTLHSLRP